MVYRLLLFLPLLSFTGGGAPPTVEVLNQTPQGMRKVSRRETPTLPPPYLHLPVFIDSRQPLVKKENLSPSKGTGQEPLPEPVRDILRPVSAVVAGSTSPPSGVSGVTVRTSCKLNKMLVQVHRSILGTGEPDPPLKLGTCKTSKSTRDYLYFEYDLGTCGAKRTMINNQVAYTNTLRYDPPKLRRPIRRAAPFALPVACYYNRYQYSYKIGFKPKVRMRKIFTLMKNRAKFILTPRNAQWERLSASDQNMLGKPMYFQAEATSMSQDERLYVHSCYVTPEKSHTSTPQFPVVKNFGCMVESKDGRSTFFPHKTNAVRFSVDAFLFTGMTGQQLYMHCSMSVGSSVPTPTAKSCNYDTKARRWVELYGPDSVCTCCDSNCNSAASAVTKIISSRPWKMEPKVKPSKAPKRKKVSTTPTTTTTTKTKKRTTEAAAAPPQPEKTKEPTDWRMTLTGDDTMKELEWPFGGGGLMWVEFEGEEKQVKGSAVVASVEEEVEKEEVEKEEVEKEEEDMLKELEWPFGGEGVMWVDVGGEEKQVKGSAVVVSVEKKEEEVEKKEEVEKEEEDMLKELEWPFGGEGVMWVDVGGEEKQVKGSAVVVSVQKKEEEGEKKEEEAEKVEDDDMLKELESPFGGEGAMWVEVGGEEKQVKGSAVVVGEKEDDTWKELEWPFGGEGVMWVEVEGEEKQVKGSAVVVEEEKKEEEEKEEEEEKKEEEEEEEEEVVVVVVPEPRIIFEDLFDFDK